MISHREKESDKTQEEIPPAIESKMKTLKGWLKEFPADYDPSDFIARPGHDFKITTDESQQIVCVEMNGETLGAILDVKLHYSSSVLFPTVTVKFIAKSVIICPDESIEGL